jgi:hypothetical protein
MNATPFCAPPGRAARLGRGAACAIALALSGSAAQAAVNSYRFLHVTIDTPWHIFLFLLMGVFAPFILMVVLMWRNSIRKRDLSKAQQQSAQSAPSAPIEPPRA